ncbi:pentapeptide repeat-containing protein [Paenibacillus chondroitinus]|uniref:Pentapeptide repeat-containing protein n=1 Tax=Paenibacillus chondroitinus TaxID=59842 RepID=A0ABU6D632_9BACL|nr:MULTISPECIES: pentapeptide repeat-containing protein [Paenibacillus]MCY9658158.1 pentapeptide repeat-containing protein [Paenibacillus anseongense]MEB4793179.1 pentapeptide repeat-containing protein [Paenibacillus chondroitinus]
MNYNNNELTITKPISVWNRPLNVDFKELFKSLGKAALSGAFGNWSEVANNSYESLCALGLEKDPGQIAWLLIFKSSTQAIYKLVGECSELLKFEEENQNTIFQEIETSLEGLEFTIDVNFFNKPKDLLILEKMKLPLSSFLLQCGLTEIETKSLVNRFPSYFVFALNEQWRKDSKEYEPIKAYFDTPFTKATEREKSWARYFSYLKLQVNQRMFDETFSLKEVYVPLRAYYEEKIMDDSHDMFESSETTIKNNKNNKNNKDNIVIDLEFELERWIESSDKRDAIRVISGGPGSGKSSFAKIFAANLVDKLQFPILFIPLHLFELNEDLINAVGRFVKYDNLLDSNPIDPDNGEQRLLVFFDGLDELSKQGQVSAEIAKHFVEELQRKVDRLNYNELRIQVILTGREISVQPSKMIFRNKKQILNLLPFYLNEEERKKYTDEEDLLEVDQRDIWWNLYGKASGRSYSSLPSELSGDNLEEITSQPLLNYLVALSFDRKKVDFAKENNLNAIYYDLLIAVYERGWANNKHPSIKDVSRDQFIRILEEIAVSVWQCDGRTTTVAEIEKSCSSSGLSWVLNRFQEGASKGVTRLLTAFYFRQSGYSNSGEHTFEFTHKSFGEYLTARRLVASVKLVNKMIKKRTTDPDQAWDERKALEFLISLCGQSEIDIYLFKFISNEIGNSSANELKELQKTLILLINFVLRTGMPIERISPRPAYAVEKVWSKNTEKALIYFLGAVALRTEKHSKIDWPTSTTFGTWLRTLVDQRKGPRNPFIMKTFIRMDLEKCDLDIGDLYETMFWHCIFDNGSLQYANLINANLTGCSFKKTLFDYSEISGAQMEYTDLRDASLRKITARSTNLKGAMLQNTIIAGASFVGADLTEANLVKATSFYKYRDINEPAKFTLAQLTNANLANSKLKGANFSKANLTNANFKGSDLTDANFRNSNVTNTNFENAKITGAKFIGSYCTIGEEEESDFDLVMDEVAVAIE